MEINIGNAWTRDFHGVRTHKKMHNVDIVQWIELQFQTKYLEKLFFYKPQERTEHEWLEFQVFFLQQN